MRPKLSASIFVTTAFEEIESLFKANVRERLSFDTFQKEKKNQKFQYHAKASKRL